LVRSVDVKMVRGGVRDKTSTMFWTEHYGSVQKDNAMSFTTTQGLRKTKKNRACYLLGEASYGGEDNRLVWSPLAEVASVLNFHSGTRGVEKVEEVA
jgi:hypothetical protein